MFVDSALTVSNDSLLTTLSMPALGHVGGKLTLLSLPLSVVQLPALYSGGGIHLDSLTRCLAVKLPNLTTLSLEFYVGYCASGNTSRPSTSPTSPAPTRSPSRTKTSRHHRFPLLTTVAHDLVIQNDAHLAQLSGFSHLTSVGGSIYILANPR